MVFEEPALVEPVDPFQGGELEIIEAAPRPSIADEFGLVPSRLSCAHTLSAP